MEQTEITFEHIKVGDRVKVVERYKGMTIERHGTVDWLSPVSDGNREWYTRENGMLVDSSGSCRIFRVGPPRYTAFSDISAGDVLVIEQSYKFDSRTLITSGVAGYLLRPIDGHNARWVCKDGQVLCEDGLTGQRIRLAARSKDAQA